MPWNPGVTDIRGQLMAQGISQAGQNISDAIRVYGQNKLLASQSIAKFEGAAQANPDLLKFLDTPNAPQEASKAYKKLMQGGTVPLKDAAVLAQFSDSYTKHKEETQQAQMRAIQMQAAQAQMAEAQRQRDQALMNQRALRDSMQPTTNVQSATGDAIQGGANFQDLVQGNVPTSRPVSTTSTPTAADAARKFIQQGGVPDQHTNPFFNLMTDAENAAAKGKVGAAPTSAMRDTDAIIYAELAAGKIKPDQVNNRRAELLAAGGRDPGSRFDNAGTFVDAETGTNARNAVKDRHTGKIGYVDMQGAFQPLDPTKWKPSTLGDTNALLDPPGMEKLREKVIADERSVRNIGRYLEGFENLDQGAGQLADRLSKNIKTIFTKQPLTEKEKATGLQQGRLQQILGGMRTTIVGPGTMTEQDAQRIIDAVGGDVNALQNQEVTKKLIGEILAEKMKEYESDLDVYNTHVVRKYGGQAGYRQREKVQVNFKVSAPASAPAAPVRKYNPATGRLE